MNAATRPSVQPGGRGRVTMIELSLTYAGSLQRRKRFTNRTADCTGTTSSNCLPTDAIGDDGPSHVRASVINIIIPLKGYTFIAIVSW